MVILQIKFSENSFTTPFTLPPGLHPVLTETGELTSPLDLQLNWIFAYGLLPIVARMSDAKVCYFVVH